MVILSESIEGSSSSTTNEYKYDVFLSFRGEDTRHNFTDHLHKALLDANISTFLDDKKIETGGDLKPELESAIRASRASIIVLSKDYANSSWCLDELVLILEQRIISNQIVIPIFYHVQPTDIRKQENDFGDAMAKYKQKMMAETNAYKISQSAKKIDRWKEALTKVANLKGRNVEGRRETEFIEEIVKDINCRLYMSSRSPLPQRFGMDDSIKFVTSWMKESSSDTGDILIIAGMDGIGKTSLAKYVYELHCCQFQTRSYVEDIGGRCEKFNDLLDLQKQLCADISKTSPVQVHDVSMYTLKIENVLASEEAFLVLDDIDSPHQLDALLGSKGFHPRSKIIITTSNMCVTDGCELFRISAKPRHKMHLLQGLCETESQKLFCFHAFISIDPKAGYEELSEKLVKYCEGYPFALEVLGKSLHDQDVTYWEQCIEWLEKETGSPVINVLRRCFYSLPYRSDQELFKHIACFFVGMDRDVTIKILKACDTCPYGIEILIHRCLLSIGRNNKLVMHRLIQEMGRFIVCEESKKPWERSRLWSHMDSYRVLKQKKGSEYLLGLTFDMRMLEKEKLSGSFELSTDALTNMDNLMLLELNYVQINGSYKNFPEELRWLCMHGFPLKSLPSELRMEYLVSLDMSYSNIESFGIFYSDHPQRVEKKQMLTRGKRLLRSLEILNLSFCENLISLGGFDQAPALERLIVTNCIGLREVCESIEQCVELIHIDLSYCSKLEKLPGTIHMLKKVETLLLDGCNHGESQIKIRNMDLSTNNVGKDTKTSPSAFLEAIQSYLKVFEISPLRSLVRNPIIFLPSCVRSLPRLERLSMKNCNMLRSVKHPPHTLTHLDLCMLDTSNKSALEYVVFDPKKSPLRLSIVWKASATLSFEIQGVVKIQPMADVKEKVLCSLGWTNLDFINQTHSKIDFMFGEPEVSAIQMYYEFGIFSTFYGGKEMPKWIRRRSNGPSISFTIPPMPNGFRRSTYKLRGLNFCFVQSASYQFQYLDLDVVHLPMIKISNKTKNRTWMYHHCVDMVSVGGEFVTMLCHWMFGMNEVEGGDEITITVTEYLDQVTKECGVSFVYDDEKTSEEDVLGYYKSWNHIIGGDLTGFKLTTGEYSLSTRRYEHKSHPYDSDDGPRYKEAGVWFRALSQGKSNILRQAHEEEEQDDDVQMGPDARMIAGRIHEGPSNVAMKTYIPDPPRNLSSGSSVRFSSLDSFNIPRRNKRPQMTAKDEIQKLEEDNGNKRRRLMDAKQIVEFPVYADMDVTQETSEHRSWVGATANDILAEHRALLLEQAQNKMKDMEAERSMLVDRLLQAEVARVKAESRLELLEAADAEFVGS